MAGCAIRQIRLPQSPQLLRAIRRVEFAATQSREAALPATDLSRQMVCSVGANLFSYSKTNATAPSDADVDSRSSAATVRDLPVERVFPRQHG